MSDSRPRYSLGLARGAAKELSIAGILFSVVLASAIVWPSPLTFASAGLLAVLLGLLVYFLRDPERTPPAGLALILAPADGQVVEVGRVSEALFLGGQALKIGIFMSVLDVHVNRSPVEGRVVLREHVPGRFLQAFRPEASEVNEHNLVGLDSPYGRVLVKQVAGVLARRVVCWVYPGDTLERGQRLGMIKLGSRVDLYLPLAAEAAVKHGDRVRAGVSVVARWKEGGSNGQLIA